MTRMLPKLIAASALLALAACGAEYTTSFDTESGSEVDKGQFGNATMNNTLIQTGQMSYTVALAERFNAEVPDSVTFEFNQATITAQAAAILDKQANFIRQFPEVRFTVFGHTDLVGSNAYNQRLGLRRANAVVDYLVGKGVDRARLKAVVSYGETRPIIQTDQPEERNRRTVTEVSGFVESNPLVLNGKYAQIIWREYVRSAVPLNTGSEAASEEAGGG